MATQKDVENLKRDWVNDPCFDLDDVEGFEDFTEELQSFQKEQEAKWAAERLENTKRKAEKWGVTIIAAEEIESCEQRAQSHSADAKRLLTHYFGLAHRTTGGSLDSDCLSEIESIADAIVDAAVAKTRASILKSSGTI